MKKRAEMNEDELIKEIFKVTKTIAIVGLSPKPHRASHHVAAYLKHQGFKIIPVYPRETEILGEKVYGSLSEIQEKVDTVCIFRDPAETPAIVREAVKLKPFAVWMQESVVNEEAAKIAQDAGINVIMDKCMYKEHCKL
jgi:predicted CoA-binding protein